jgi:rhodanese-related sulfurtransferase
MKRTMVQFCAVLAVMLVAGTAYNLANSGNPNKYLAWHTTKFGPGITPPPKRVPDVTPPPEGTPPVKEAPKPQAPESKKEATPDSGAQTGVLQPTARQADSSDYRLINIEDAVREYKDGTTFIDARRTKDYEAGHITGALPMSPYEADVEEKIGRFKENPETIAEAPIVAYCTNANDCEDSKFLSQQLKAAGFPNVMVYTGGFWDWQKAHPEYVTKGKEPGKREP